MGSVSWQWGLNNLWQITPTHHTSNADAVQETRDKKINRNQKKTVTEYKEKWLKPMNKTKIIFQQDALCSLAPT